MKCLYLVLLNRASLRYNFVLFERYALEKRYIKLQVGLHVSYCYQLTLLSEFYYLDSKYTKYINVINT